MTKKPEPQTTNQQRVEEWHLEWLYSEKPHWGDKISWSTADEIARRLDQAVLLEKP